MRSQGVSSARRLAMEFFCGAYVLSNAMNLVTYQEMAETETTYWWFSDRRYILSRVIKSLGLLKNPKILEIGV
jgi:hypothetical protein